MTDAFIVFFGTLGLVFAGLVLMLRQPMRAALALVAHMTCLAAIFACLSVHVIALFQVLIYVGAVMVFMVYTIMLLDDRDSAYQQRFSGTVVAGIAVAVTLVAILLALLGASAIETPPVAASGSPPADATEPPFAFGAFSAVFMKQYWFHFELATVLLLAGILSAWTVMKEGR
jgi:NADH-quinone oxidoreductase subunit J